MKNDQQAQQPKQKTSKGLKWAGLSAGLIFFIFALLQLNDFTQYKNADWWSWMIFYLGTASISVAVGLGWLRSIAFLSFVGGFSLGSFIFRMQDEYGNFQFEKFGGNWFRDEVDMIQQTNEAGGLLLVAIWLFTLIFLLKRSTKL